jgi:hypothetical protein
MLSHLSGGLPDPNRSSLGSLDLRRFGVLRVGQSYGFWDRNRKLRIGRLLPGGLEDGPERDVEYGQLQVLGNSEQRLHCLLGQIQNGLPLFSVTDVLKLQCL